jgi:hypothetical protein
MHSPPSVSQGRFEPRVRIRFSEIVHRMHLERPLHVGIVRGDEYDLRKLLVGQSRYYAEPVEVGHLHVEENQLGTRTADLYQHLHTGPAFGDQLDI